MDAPLEHPHIDEQSLVSIADRFGISLLPGSPVTLEQIERLEAEMHSLPGDVKIIPHVTHRFADGLYIRTAHFPAGSILVGEMHRFSHYSALMAGRMVTSIDGVMLEVGGPADVVAQPGTKRVGMALTDIVWTTVHGNAPATTDVAELEDWMVVPNPLSGRGMLEHRENEQIEVAP